MPNQSYSDVTTDAEQILTSTTANPDLQAALKRLKERLIFLRAAIRGDIGPRTEKLVEYGIAPLRKRGRKPKPSGEPEKLA
jgi:hypothetical protein